MRESYRRHLPHQIPAGFPIFLTWNLKGALPQCVLEELRAERERLERQALLPNETPGERKIRHGKLLFAKADRFLDRQTEGPLHLKDPHAAKIVADAILFGAGQRYDLFAYVVMANHVHVLLTPIWELARVTGGIKGYTAYQINALQGQRGRIFWQDESYDHWARDEGELGRILDYIEGNPVTATLCAQPNEWPWSSAALRSNWLAGQPYRRNAPA